MVHEEDANRQAGLGTKRERGRRGIRARLTGSAGGPPSAAAATEHLGGQTAMTRGISWAVLDAASPAVETTAGGSDAVGSGGGVRVIF